MADRVKGIVVEIGGDTVGLSKALSGVNKEIGNTQRELKDVERLLKLDPTNTELLRQKQELLAKSVEQTSGKLEQLKNAEKQVQQQMKEGKASEEQYNRLQREIIATEQQLSRAEKAAQEFDDEVRQGNADKEMRQTEKAVDGVADALDDAKDSASSFGDYLKAGAIVEGAKGIFSAMRDAAEETKEYNRIMASLEVSSQKAGYTAEETAQSYRTLYGVLGDEQTAATTTANLQALGLSQQDLNQLINGSIGAWATYGDSIPIDGLSEAINETIRVGQVTGTFADVLNWAGTNEDAFNERLQAAADETERTNIVLQELAEQGLMAAGEAWQENNQGLVDSNKAAADLQEQMAQLGEIVLPVITEVTGAVAKFLGWFNSLDDSGRNFLLTVAAIVVAIGPVSGIVSTITGAIGLMTGTMTTASTASTFLASAIGFLTSPIGLVVVAVAGLVAAFALFGDDIQRILEEVDSFLQGVFATDWTTVFGPVLGGALNNFFSAFQIAWNSVKTVLNGIITFVQGVFSGNWQQAWEGIVQIFGGIFGGIVELAKAPLNGVIGLLNGAVNAINKLIDGFNSIGFDMPDWLGGGSWHPNLPHIPSIPYLAKGGILTQGSAIVGEAGPELLTLSNGKAIVQPLGGGGPVGAAITQTNYFTNYKPRDGAAAVRDLNRQLGWEY